MRLIDRQNTKNILINNPRLSECFNKVRSVFSKFVVNPPTATDPRSPAFRSDFQSEQRNNIRSEVSMIDLFVGGISRATDQFGVMGFGEVFYVREDTPVRILQSAGWSNVGCNPSVY